MSGNSVIDHHRALIYLMVMVSAADAQMTDAELETIGENVRYLPVFQDFNRDKLPLIARECIEILDGPEGLEQSLELIKSAMPVKLRETAYAVACDIAVADGRISQEGLRLLEMIRHKLDVDRLCAAAIERGARARHARL